ncbi:Tim44/TimA family putative adaptor protein [Saccharibacter sp. 17.LH.SD]|uniref:Tim44/TimA family putative adaptor protein n=1 Tax=Saccharibacter sp. 17.LH.SD TaxID=2689393 RepID=UPI0013712097|nr:Tim44/TimA family putative adaptor protein [Saccharibacter sp. 17.LH.SD]MXV44151.1 Tim44/TimA family putative adaptor protein [Saccharibacter sp. 17.LH.SD]
MAHFPWDIVILAVLALFTGAALIRVLGRKVGAQTMQQKHHPLMSRAEGVGQQNRAGVALQPPPLPGSVQAEPERTEYIVPGGTTAQGQALAKVGVIVPSFQGEKFLKYVEDVFGQILKAFARGERVALEGMVTPELMTVFGQALVQRQADNGELYCDLKRVERLEIKDVVLPQEGQDGEGARPCRIMVGITSWQIRYMRDVQGNIVDGTEALTEYRDLWGLDYVNGRWWLAETSAA